MTPRAGWGFALVHESAAAPVTVEPADLVDAPTLNPQGWPDTFNETFVRFTNRDKRFQEDSVAYRDRGNFQITQAVLSQTLNRLWITRQAVAQKIANAAGRVAAQPLLAGTLQLRKSKASELTTGDLFSLTFPQSGVNGALCRVERLTLPAPGQATATIQFKEDTGFFNTDHYAAGADDTPPENVFEVQALGFEKPVEAPWGFQETSTPQIVFLAARGDLVSNGFNLWKQRSDLSYRDVGAFDNFAQRGHVVADYPAGTLLIDDYLGIEIQFDSLDNDFDEITFLEAQQNRLLVFVGNEILSVWNPQLVAAGRYRLWTIRARYDTKRETHAADTEVWVVLREDLAIAPGRLHDVSNAADFVALTETNFEILTSEVFKQQPTYVSGVPTTMVGPPTTGSHVLDEIYKDALGGVFKCTVAGTPGTWKQALPAGVTADPATGTIPMGYLTLNVTEGTLKRHAGGYDWQTVIGAMGDKIGFYGVTPVTQPAGADQAAVTPGNANGEIAGLTFSDPPTQAEVQALRDKCEELADDVRALSTLVHALRGALVAVGVVKGGA